MKKLLLSIPLLACALALGLTSCNENTNVDDFEVDQKYEYFPLEIGKYFVYAVDSVVYDTLASGVVATPSSSFVREEITDTLRDNSGRLAYRIERSYRRNSDDPWQISDIWVSLRTDRQAERVEENLRYVKLVFPLIEGVGWNGNLFIDETTLITIAGESVELFKDWSYFADQVDVAETIGDIAFDNV
ncbi:MAG: hypothetical protein AAFV25_26420, partial [Bacteroidota bacterium]